MKEDIITLDKIENSLEKMKMKKKVVRSPKHQCTTCGKGRIIKIGKYSRNIR